MDPDWIKSFTFKDRYYPSLLILPLGNSLNSLSRGEGKVSGVYPPHSSIGDLLLGLIPKLLYCLLATTLGFPPGG